MMVTSLNALLPDEGHLAVRGAFDAPWPGPRGETVCLRDGEISLTIRPFDGCRMTSLTFFGHEVLRQWTPERRAFQYGSFPMIPWVGRMRNGRLSHLGNFYDLPVNKPPHALHGMACFAPWETVEATADRASFRFALDAPWPWRGEVRQSFAIIDGGLDIRLKIVCADTPFPAAAGWHPWFRKDIEGATDRLKIEFGADWQEEPGNDDVPTGRRIPVGPGPWDDCFGFDGTMRARLIWRDLLTMEMTSTSSSMVVFDKPEDAACVEPLSGPPNGVNSAPYLVTPDCPLEIRTRWVPLTAS